jgi:hypothetical protein
VTTDFDFFFDLSKEFLSLHSGAPALEPSTSVGTRMTIPWY